MHLNDPFPDLLIIGLGYRKRHGKDTVANYMQAITHNIVPSSIPIVIKGAHKIAFADKLKAEAAQSISRLIDSIPVPTGDDLNLTSEEYITLKRLDTDARAKYILDQMYDDNTKEFYRAYMEWYGTEFRRRLYGDNYWILAVEKTLKFMQEIKSNKGQTIILIPDVRFSNEIKAVKAWGGVTINVHREGFVDPNASTHVSQTGLDNFNDWDITINNNATLEVLRDRSGATLLGLIHAKWQ
jgi:hypothetical protein